MCFEEFYGKDTIKYKEMHESLISVLRSLFQKYSASARHGNGFHPDDQSSHLPIHLSFIESSLLKEWREWNGDSRMEIVDDCVGCKRMLGTSRS